MKGCKPKMVTANGISNKGFSIWGDKWAIKFGKVEMDTGCNNKEVACFEPVFPVYFQVVCEVLYLFLSG